MNISQLLEALKNPSISLSVSEKLLAGLSVTILSMVVVFIVLVIIALIISLLQREKSNTKSIDILETKINDFTKNQVDINKTDNMEELVAAITAAIAANTGNSTDNIVVRKIIRSNNIKSSWERMPKSTIK